MAVLAESYEVVWMIVWLIAHFAIAVLVMDVQALGPAAYLTAVIITLQDMFVGPVTLAGIGLPSLLVTGLASFSRFAVIGVGDGWSFSAQGTQTGRFALGACCALFVALVAGVRLVVALLTTEAARTWRSFATAVTKTLSLPAGAKSSLPLPSVFLGHSVFLLWEGYTKTQEVSNAVFWFIC